MNASWNSAREHADSRSATGCPTGLTPEQRRRVFVGSAADIAPGDALRVAADVAGTGDAIAVFHSDNGEYFAIDDTCTHEVASLSDGWLEGDEVECPMHAARFCLRTGRALCLPAIEPVATHEVEVDDDGVWLVPGAGSLR